MEHGLKDIAFYVQKHITPCTVVKTSLLVRDKPLGAPASVKRVYFTYLTRTKNKSKSKLEQENVFKVGQYNQYNISSHLKWVLVADRSVHIIKYDKIREIN